MRLRPTPPDVTEGFTRDNDIFSLAGFGQQLANLVQNVEGPLVILLDGPWGSGKSTFISQWMGLLKSRAMPVIYFDAFANDYQDDAFVALASEIGESAKGVSAKTKRAFFDKAKKVGTILLPIAVKATLRAATLGVLSGEALADAGDGIKEAAKTAVTDIEGLTADLINQKLKHAESDRKTLEGFRTILGEIAGEIRVEGDDSSKGRLIFIVDELDRCRPSFALNVLERVKHFFSVENVCFVLVANRAQLAASISGIYGAEFSSDVYLQKFFHLRVTLPTISAVSVRPETLERYVLHVWNNLGLNSGDGAYDERTRSGIAALATVHGLGLRDIEHVLSDLALFLAATTKANFRPDPLVVTMAIMKIKAPVLFATCVQGNPSWESIKDFLKSDRWPEKTSVGVDWYGEWWRGIVDDNWNDKSGTETKRQINGSLFHYNFGSPKRALRWVAEIMNDVRLPELPAQQG